MSISGLSPGLSRIVVTLTGNGWAAESKFVPFGGVQSVAAIVSSVLSIDFAPLVSSAASAVFTLTGVLHPSSPQPESSSVAGASYAASSIVDVCQSGTLSGLASDLLPPAVTVVKFQMSVTISTSFDRDDFIQVLAAELNCPPQQIFIDWDAAKLSSVVLKNAALSSILAVSPRNSVTLQVEFRWNQYSNSAVAPGELMSRLESKLADPSSAIKTQLGITGITRPAPASAPATASAALSGGAIAGIVIAVLVAASASLAWVLRHKLRPVCRGLLGRAPANVHYATSLNDVSIATNPAMADTSLNQSPGPVSLASASASPFLADASRRSAAQFQTPPKKPLPMPPAAHFQDSNRYSMVFSGVQSAEMSRELDLSMQSAIEHDDIVDLSNFDDDDVVSIEME